MDKRRSLNDVVTLISPGSTLALGGVTLYRRPMAFVRSLILHHRNENVPDQLTLLAFTAGMESDWLVGAGMINRVRTCYFGLEIFGLAPMFTYFANHGLLELIEETESSLAFGIRAQMAGVGFMPGKGWIGTDLPRLRPDLKKVIDPYSGEEYMAFQAIQPDVAVIHALRADWDGNTQIGDHKGIDIELAQVARQVIVTAEEIVPSLDKADIISPMVSVVVEAKGGAAPTSCHPNYALDGKAILEYTEQVADPDSFESYISNVL